MHYYRPVDHYNLGISAGRAYNPVVLDHKCFGDIDLLVNGYKNQSPVKKVSDLAISRM